MDIMDMLEYKKNFVQILGSELTDHNTYLIYIKKLTGLTLYNFYYSWISKNLSSETVKKIIFEILRQGVNALKVLADLKI